MVTSYLQFGCLFIHSMCNVNVVEYLPCIHEQLVNMVYISSEGERCVRERYVRKDEGPRKCKKEGGGERYLHLWNSCFVSSSPVS